jgi:hypothetical protein
MERAELPLDFWPRTSSLKHFTMISEGELQATSGGHTKKHSHKLSVAYELGLCATYRGWQIGRFHQALNCCAECRLPKHRRHISRPRSGKGDTPRIIRRHHVHVHARWSHRRGTHVHVLAPQQFDQVCCKAADPGQIIFGPGHAGQNGGELGIEKVCTQSSRAELFQLRFSRRIKDRLLMILECEI